MIDHECFTQAWPSCLEPGHPVGKEPLSEVSLSGEPECLSPCVYASTSVHNTQGHPIPCPKQGLAIPPRGEKPGDSWLGMLNLSVTRAIKARCSRFDKILENCLLPKHLDGSGRRRCLSLREYTDLPLC